jgi:hypothetical protein
MHTTDKILEVLADYCQELRTTVAEQHKSLVWAYKQTDEKVALLESSWARVNELEDELKEWKSANATMESEISHLTAISSGDEG